MMHNFINPFEGSTMNHLGKIALSASVMIVTAQAMSAVAKERPEPIQVPVISDISGVSGLDVFGRAEVRQATGLAFPALVSGFKSGGQTLEERYQVAQTNDFVQGGNVGNPSPSPNTVSCHSACHQDSGGYC